MKGFFLQQQKKGLHEEVHIIYKWNWILLMNNAQVTGLMTLGAPKC